MMSAKYRSRLLAMCGPDSSSVSSPTRNLNRADDLSKASRLAHDAIGIFPFISLLRFTSIELFEFQRLIYDFEKFEPFKTQL